MLAPNLPAGRSPGIGQERIGPFHGPRRIDAIARSWKRGDERAQVCRIDPTDPRAGGAPEGGVGRPVVGLGRAGQGDLHRVEDSGRRAQCPHVRDTAVRPACRTAPASFTESVIREMTRLAAAARRGEPGAGLSRLRRPPELKEAAKAAIDADINQYAITWGAKRLPRGDRRQDDALVPRAGGRPGDRDHRHLRRDRGHDRRAAGDWSIPATRWWSSSRSTRTTAPDAILSGAVPRYVTLHAPDWRFDPDELRAAFRPRTRGDHPEHRRTTPPARCSPARSWSSSRACASEYDALVPHRRDLRAHPLRRRAHPDGDAAGHGRATVAVNSL